jgi:DNA recombination-dependent growth factor C
MPVLRGSVTFSRFRTEPAKEAPSDPKRWMTRGLKSRAFEPIDLRTEDDRSAGFVELENPDSVDFPAGSVFYGEYALLGYRVDQIRVPSSAVKSELDRWAAAFEKEQGRPAGKSEKAAHRATIRQQLRTRAVPRTKVHDLSWNLKTNQLQIWAASRKLVEEIQGVVEAAFDVKLVPLVPSALALKAGIEEGALAPTAELVGGTAAAEVSGG